MTRTEWSGSSVENKFWAGLTSAQPVGYLKALAADASSALVFIVPHHRVSGLWGELREKCRGSNIELTSESKGHGITWARAGQRTLAVTSWKHVLERLDEAATDPALRQDIAQLRGLTDRMNFDAFLPLRDEEVTDLNVARRLINYTRLIDEIVGRLTTDGIPDAKKLGRSCGYDFAGRFLQVHSRFQLWLESITARGALGASRRSGRRTTPTNALPVSRGESARPRSCSTMRVQSKASCTFRFASRREPIGTV